MKRTRTESVPKLVVVQTVCDACGKVGEGDEPAGWHHFSSSHGEWGSDSSDSWEDHDVCSFVCYLKIVKERFDYWGAETASLEIDGKDVEFVRGMLAREETTPGRSAL